MKDQHGRENGTIHTCNPECSSCTCGTNNLTELPVVRAKEKSHTEKINK